LVIQQTPGLFMLTLYRFADAGAEYWETWERDDGAHVMHWGKVGKAGDVELVESTAQQSADVIIQKKIDARTAAGFARFPRERIATLWIEYDLLNLGSEKDLKKRLEKRLEELLGWTALGQVDGSKIRSGKLEVRMLVVDADLAARFLAAGLAGTDFDDYSWIYEVLPGDGADAASVPLPPFTVSPMRPKSIGRPGKTSRAAMSCIGESSAPRARSGPCGRRPRVMRARSSGTRPAN
jgi:hypothetical protein